MKGFSMILLGFLLKKSNYFSIEYPGVKAPEFILRILLLSYLYD